MEPSQKEEAPQARSKNVLQQKRLRHDPKSAPQAIKIAHSDTHAYTREARIHAHGRRGKRTDRERETGARTSLHSMFREEEEDLVARMRDGNCPKRRTGTGTIPKCALKQAPQAIKIAHTDKQEKEKT